MAAVHTEAVAIFNDQLINEVKDKFSTSSIDLVNLLIVIHL